MNKKLLWVGALALIVALGAYFYSSKGTQEVSGESIKVAAILPFTGPAAYYAEQTKKGIELALDEIRSDSEQVVEVVYEDNMFTAKGGLDAYQKIKNAGGAGAIITGASPPSLAIQSQATADNMLLMGVHVTTDGYSTPNDLSFRTSPSARVEGPVVAKYLKETEIKSVGIIYLNNDYGVSIKDAFKKALVDEGTAIEVIAEEGYSPDTKDYRTTLLKIKDKNPDALYIATVAPQAANILIQSKEIDFAPAFISTRASEDPVLIKIAGQTADNLVYPYSFDPGASAFSKAFQKKYGELPDAYAAEGYEATKLVVQAVQKCGNDNKCTQSYLSSLKDEPSAFGPLSFDANGDVSYPLFMKVIKNGQFVELE